MGISTVGFVATPEKDVWRVTETVSKALTAWIRASLPPETGPLQAYQRSLVSIRLCAPRFVGFDFREPGSNLRRTMHLHFDADADYREQHEGLKLIFSLNAWGESEAAIKVVGQALSKELAADFYFTTCDCGDEWQAVRFGELVAIHAKGGL